MISNNDVAEWLQVETGDVLSTYQSMGSIETAIAQKCKEVQRVVLERHAQTIANGIDMRCPTCAQSLKIVAHNRPRTVESIFGKIKFERSYGYCSACEEHCYPADAALGLHDRAAASPRVQEIAALSVLRTPAGRAEEDVERLSGVEICASTLHREARRQGERALAIRGHDELLTQSSAGIAKLATQAPKLPSHSTLVIEIDAWNIRERDNWGKTEELQKEGKNTERWHWVLTGTLFRLDQRGTSETGRAMIADRGYVATRSGIESFRNQLYAEALRRGMSQAETVLCIADGAVWIWNLVDDRFKDATQRVDLYHVKEHLWDLANELHGKGTAEAKEWISPYLDTLDSEDDAAVSIIGSLDELSKKVGEFSEKQIGSIKREKGYFERHQNRMDYKNGKELGQPVGSGAIESTCSQYQGRFKMTGQFWSLEGDEAFLALSTLLRNGRWGELFP